MTRTELLGIPLLQIWEDGAASSTPKPEHFYWGEGADNQSEHSWLGECLATGWSGVLCALFLFKVETIFPLMKKCFKTAQPREQEFSIQLTFAISISSPRTIGFIINDDQMQILVHAVQKKTY